MPVHLTQTGLTQRNSDALDISDLLIVHTPTTCALLDQDVNGDDGCATYNYASVVGMLQYLQAQMFAVSQVSRFVHNPKWSHELALEQIVQYLMGTKEKGLIVKPSNKLSISAYIDDDFAGLWGYQDKMNPISVKSRSGYVICVSDCPVI